MVAQKRYKIKNGTENRTSPQITKVSTKQIQYYIVLKFMRGFYFHETLNM